MVIIDCMERNNITYVSRLSRMAEAGFSEDGNYYSLITEDGRLRIWDTETNTLKQEYTPDLHLTSPPTCLQWIKLLNTQNGSRTPRKNNSSDQELNCIALGTKKGTVLIYSLSEANVISFLTSEENEIEKNKQISAIDWHRDYGFITCNQSQSLFEWDLKNASVTAKYKLYFSDESKQSNHISAVKFVPHKNEAGSKYVVTATTKLHLWQLQDSIANIVKVLGSNTLVNAKLALTSFQDRSCLVEGSQTERLLTFWDVTVPPELKKATPSNKRKRKKTLETEVVPLPAYNFVLEDAPRALDLKIEEDDGTKLSIAAVTRSGVIHYYSHILNGSSLKPIKPTVTLQVCTADAQPFTSQCCQISGNDVLVGYWKNLALVFERITPDVSSKTQIIIRGEAKKAANKSKDNKKKKTITEDDGITYVEPLGGISRKRSNPGASVEVPMESRLSNLTLDPERKKAAVNQNLTKLLVQGLHSKDKDLIMTVLHRDDSKLAHHTVSNLPAAYIPLLLEQLAEMAPNKTTQCAYVCTWLKALINCHSALILATINSKSSDHLTQLLAIFVHRRSHLCQLLNLKGRLALMDAQKSKAFDSSDQLPLIEYNDNSSSSEMELENYKSDSEEEEWDADEDNADEENNLESDEENDDDDDEDD